MTTCENALKALDFIPCADQRYGSWIRVGMGLHRLEETGENYDSDGNAVDVLAAWIAWSMTDPDRFHEGECAAKWATFGSVEGVDPIGPATVIAIAKDYGYTPAGARDDTELGWGDTAVIGAPRQDPGHGVRQTASPPKMSLEYLKAIFGPDEHVAYTVTFYENGKRRGKLQPYGCVSDRTSGEISAELEALVAQGDDDVNAVFGIPSPRGGGACVCVNPTDGIGRKKENITDYRHLVAESDEDDPDSFIRVTRSLRLPVVALVSSGNRSVHAVVRVDCGTDAKLYENRFKTVRSAYADRGITIDEACSNPSRMSRLPGVMRGDRMQELIATGIGMATWEEWEPWYRKTRDRLRLPGWDTVQARDPPPRAPVLVEGILRAGHIGIVSAKAKQGKSWLAIMLAVAVATGGEWLGRACRQGRVLYIDPEIDGRSLSNRFSVVCEAMCADPELVDRQVSKWSLRGLLTTDGSPPVMEDLAHDIEISGQHFDLVIIDSCSCFIGADGDENSSVAVRGLFAFVHRICRCTGASALLVHHHGKGASGDREASDRARGSSVWIDAPDAALTLTEIVPPSGEASDYLGEGARAMVLEDVGVREFPSFAPVHLIYRYPIHRLDDGGVTDDWKPCSGSQRGGKATAAINRAKAAARRDACIAALNARLSANPGVTELAGAEAARVCSEATGETVSAQTLKRYLLESPDKGLSVKQVSDRRWCVNSEA